MPIEIRELVIKTTVPDSDADESRDGTDGGNTEDGDGAQAPRADATTELNDETDFNGEDEMAIYVNFPSARSDAPAIEMSQDTLDLDLDGNAAGVAERSDDAVSDQISMNFEPIRDDDGGVVQPDLALADVDPELSAGGVLVHEVGHWLG